MSTDILAEKVTAAGDAEEERVNLVSKGDGLAVKEVAKVGKVVADMRTVMVEK